MAMIRKGIRALRRSPYLIVPPWTCSVRIEKSGLLTMAEISGLIRSATKALTIARKCDADHDRDGKIDHVAAQDKVAKSFEHWFS